MVAEKKGLSQLERVSPEELEALAQYLETLYEDPWLDLLFSETKETHWSSCLLTPHHFRPGGKPRRVTQVPSLGKEKIDWNTGAVVTCNFSPP